MFGKLSIKSALQIFILVSVAVLLIWAWVLLRNPAYFPIHDVEIQASYQHIAPQTIQKVIAPFSQQSFFALNAKSLKKQLLDIPWIYQVVVRRVWPAKIIVKIVEQQAVVRWNDDSLFNAQGDLFTPEKITANDLPVIVAPDDQSAQAWRLYQHIAQQVGLLGLHVVKLEMNNDRMWAMQLDDGIIVQLGKVAILSKVVRLVALYPKIIGGRGDAVAKIDLRYRNGVAVHWKK
ncbi:MAG: cell division protein FtsQ/DivIB [Gammaproteobacteria bacterium]|nr:cell division protein FtsQ/DivIB [Gammaproteobacteria bacterium]